MNNKFSFQTSKYLIVTLVILFITKSFQSTPFEIIFFEIQAVFIVIMFLYFLKELSYLKKYREEPIFKYLFFLIIILPLYSSIRANIVFNQSYYLGLLAMRGVLLLMATIWIYNYLMKGKISFYNLEKIFLWLGWLSVFVFTFIYFFVNPNSFVDSSFVNYDPLRGYRYKFQVILALFMLFYYLIKYRENGQLKDLISYLILFAFFLFVISGRGNLLILLFVSLIIFLKNINATRFLKLSILISSGLVVVYIFSDILFPNFISSFLIRINEALTVLGGNATSDPSANSRILQSEIIFNFLSKNISSFWFGVGHLSNHFGETANKGGFNAVFGYLYPTDTGLIGVVFEWGIIGIIFLYLIPVAFIIRIIKDSSINKNIFITTINYFLIYVLIGSLYTGNIVFEPAFIFFVMGIKIAYNKKYRKEIVEQ